MNHQNTLQAELEAILTWSPAREVNTKYGPKRLRTAPLPPDHAFHAVWQRAQGQLRAAGISVGNHYKTGLPEVCWWTAPPAAEVAKKEEAVSMSRQEELTTDVDIPAPKGLAYLPYQKVGIVFAGSKPGVLIADEMGLGKSIQGVGIINNNTRIARVLVICPASLKINWWKELKKWLVRPLSVGIADGQCFPTTDVVIVNYDVIHKWGNRTSFDWDLLIVDEAHCLKNPKARRTKHVIGYRAKKGEDKNVSAIPAKRRVFLTGTPIVNKPLELWPIISSLDSSTWNNFFKFATRYCGAKQVSIGGGKAAWDFTGSSHLGELQEKLRSTIMIRRLKKDVLKDLPAKQRQVIELPVPPEAMHLIKTELSLWEKGNDEELEAEVELSMASDDPEAYTRAVTKLNAGRNASFTEMSDLRHQTALAKVPQMIEAIQEDVENVGVKLLVFAHHKDVIAAFMAHFPRAVKVVGGMTAQEKDAAVTAFQNDPEVGPFFGNIQAAGVGLTLTRAQTVIFAELDWVPGNVTQAEDRAHRIGQKGSVLVKHYVMAGSLDAKMAKTIIRKQSIIDQALDATNSAETTRARANFATPAEMEAKAQSITAPQRTAILEALKLLAGVCNGARSWDGAGFSKYDAHIGKSLAESFALTPKQAVLGQRLVAKYRRQLPPRLVELAGAKTGKEEED